MQHLIDTASLSHRKPSIIGLNTCRQFAVCIPLIETDHGFDILFEVRPSHMRQQPGDICFPGGKVEEGETPYEGAIRECMEELLVTKDQIEYIGPGDILYRNEMLAIHSYIIRLKDYDGTHFDPVEVKETFTVPLDYFLGQIPEEHFVESKVMPDDDFPFHKIVGGKNYRWRKRGERTLFYEYEDRVIWGLTAKIMESFVHIIKDHQIT